MATIRTTPTFDGWFGKLRDRQTKARIAVRIDRLADGNPGQYRALTGGISELKIDVGPGYRVYYTERAGQIIVLLVGGDKSSQAADLAKARDMAKNLA
ncbi:type II toxin-antitoxin system RelE/ParE family toxin [Rhodanobacter sp. T12-5]|nr:type II toxin-antitoxin system RelE/ParE family toxin [Rhodanobacter sp. T12-5]KAA0071691.1 type II toxin-antitoxin system RelE/ParE family toxin [Rhodanobacter sp. T12-5]